MFITLPEAEIAFLNAMLGQDGAKRWSYVELAVAHPWFCVSVRHEERGMTLTRTFHLSNYRLLNSISEMAGESIERVEVALPHYMTGKEGWIMKPLRAIWSGKAPDNSTQSVYVTMKGE